MTLPLKRSPLANLHTAEAAPLDDALRYQESIFPRVSRSFALTVPLLPAELRKAVTTAYLLCRMADTIEDETALSLADKCRDEQAFLHAVTCRIDARRFADELVPRLSDASSAAEKDLLSHLPDVLQVMHALNPRQQAAIVNCLGVMCSGMSDFQRVAGLQGLATVEELDRYCYCVAGVVGEMLAEVFIDFEPEMAVHRALMQPLSVSFGQGLQLTNILKDQWEDRQRGLCWLPRDVFARHGVSLPDWQGEAHPGSRAAMMEVIGMTHAHLRDALTFTLLIPSRHTSLRFFCLHAIGLALLTLRNIHQHLDFKAAAEIKVSRTEASVTGLTLKLMARRDRGLRALFKRFTQSLPLTELSARH